MHSPSLSLPTACSACGADVINKKVVERLLPPSFAVSSHANLLCTAVVDWNPSGMHIYSVYKHGSRAWRGSAQYALPGLECVAVRAGMLHGVPTTSCRHAFAYPSHPNVFGSSAHDPR